MKTRVFANYDALTVGETAQVWPEYGVKLTHKDTGALTRVFQFEHMELDKDETSDAPRWIQKPLQLTGLKQVMSRWQTGLEGRGWNSSFLSNHDVPRMVSRYGNDTRYRRESAKMLATFIHMLKGTPYIYQGDEIGMTNVAFDAIEDYRDVETLQMYEAFTQERGIDSDAVMAMIHATSRDNARTPMQWNAGEEAGFTTGTPWMRVNPNHTDINVENAVDDPDSVFHYMKKLIQLRRSHSIVVHGTYTLILEDHEKIYAFTRDAQDERLLVILNFGEDTPRFELPAGLEGANKTLLISNYELTPDQSLDKQNLRPYEAQVYYLS